MLYTSGNRSPVQRGWTYEVVIFALEYSTKVRATGADQNCYLRELMQRIDGYYFAYAGLYSGPNGIPYNQIKLWSKKAIDEYAKDKTNIRNFVRDV
jgi:hypothetical protein